VLISLLMIFWGTLATQIERPATSRLSNVAVWGTASIGMLLALRIFMADTLRVKTQGIDAIRNVLPEQFNWPWFTVALVLMSAPVIQLLLPTRKEPVPALPNLELAGK
jgi:hypothetical protein